MAINPQIALGIQTPQVQMPDPNAGMNALARALQIKGLRDEQVMRSQELAERNALNEVYSGALGSDGSVDRNLLYRGMASRNLGSKIPGMQKQFAEADTAAATLRAKQIEAQKGELEMGIKKAEHVSSILSQATDPQRYAMVRGIVKSQYGQDLPEQFDPAYISARVAEGQTITQRLQSEHQRLTLAETSRHNRTTEGETARHNRSSEGIQIRGQDLVNQRSIDQNSIQAGQKTQQGVIELRKEFNALPDVKKFREVLPVIQSVQRAPNTPAGDIDLIYGVGKVMDPESVVREGEMTLVIKSGSPAQRLQGLVSYVQGGGRLTPAQRQELMAVLQSRVQGLKANYDAARSTYETAADRGGLPKDQIFIENPMPADPPVEFGSLPTGKPRNQPAGRGGAPTAVPRELQWGK